MTHYTCQVPKSTRIISFYSKVVPQIRAFVRCAEMNEFVDTMCKGSDNWIEDHVHLIKIFAIINFIERKTLQDVKEIFEYSKEKEKENYEWILDLIKSKANCEKVADKPFRRWKFSFQDWVVLCREVPADEKIIDDRDKVTYTHRTC